MSTVLMMLIAVAGVALVAIVALRGNHRGFSQIASRMDSHERRMAVLESYMRPKASPQEDADEKLAEASPLFRKGAFMSALPKAGSASAGDAGTGKGSEPA